MKQFYGKRARMMINKKFDLLKGVSNLLDFSTKEIKAHSIENGQKLLKNVIEMTELHTEHFAKKSIAKQLQNINGVAVIMLETYPLWVSYNVPTDQIVINLFPFNVSTITAIRPDPRNIYAAMVYGICFKNLIKNERKGIKERYASIFSSYYTSMFVQMFGKEYGLLYKYSKQIPMLKYVITYYVLRSFFEVDPDKAIDISKMISGFGGEEIDSKLKQFDMTNIGAMLDALSKLEILPGITKPLFMGKLLKYTGIQFIPALEDMSRFISIASASIVNGSNIIPTFIRKYNEDEFANIIEISKAVNS